MLRNELKTVTKQLFSLIYIYIYILHSFRVKFSKNSNPTLVIIHIISFNLNNCMKDCYIIIKCAQHNIIMRSWKIRALVSQSTCMWIVVARKKTKNISSAGQFITAFNKYVILKVIGCRCGYSVSSYSLSLWLLFFFNNKLSSES